MGLIDDQLEAAELSLQVAMICLQTAREARLVMADGPDAAEWPPGIRSPDSGAQQKLGASDESGDGAGACTHGETIPAEAMGNHRRRYCPACETLIGGNDSAPGPEEY